MSEPAATIDDLRAAGARHGATIARCMISATANGLTAEANMMYHLDHVMPAKRRELRDMGASDEEIETYIRASIATTEQLMDEAAEALSAAVERGAPSRSKRICRHKSMSRRMLPG